MAQIFQKFSTRGGGVRYNLPNGVQARIMQPSGTNPLRVSFGNGYTRVTAEGLVPQRPFGLSLADKDQTKMEVISTLLDYDFKEEKRVEEKIVTPFINVVNSSQKLRSVAQQQGTRTN